MAGSVNSTSPLTYVDTYPAHTTTHIHSASALDGPQQQQQQQHEESVASQVAACAKSLSLSSTRQLLPSAAFAAKAASTTSAFTPRPVASGPAFLVVTSGSGGDGEESEAGVVEATLRIHGVGVGAKQQHQQHHRLRGVVGSHLLLRDDDEGEGALGLYAPTPECAAASQSVSHLYAHGRIPHCESFLHKVCVVFGLCKTHGRASYMPHTNEI